VTVDTSSARNDAEHMHLSADGHYTAYNIFNKTTARVVFFGHLVRYYLPLKPGVLATEPYLKHLTSTGDCWSSYPTALSPSLMINTIDAVTPIIIIIIIIRR